mmetsp:Transcript_39303/g.127191  ORF Transcript_39303/g.127191 Transcript_39303/m.127191 type:complete len:357 (-) Transcript_39303:284-1354(-)
MALCSVGPPARAASAAGEAAGGARRGAERGARGVARPPPAQLRHASLLVRRRARGDGLPAAHRGGGKAAGALVQTPCRGCCVGARDGRASERRGGGGRAAPLRSEQRGAGLGPVVRPLPRLFRPCQRHAQGGGGAARLCGTTRAGVCGGWLPRAAAGRRRRLCRGRVARLLRRRRVAAASTRQEARSLPVPGHAEPRLLPLGLAPRVRLLWRRVWRVPRPRRRPGPAGRRAAHLIRRALQRPAAPVLRVRRGRQPARLLSARPAVLSARSRRGGPVPKGAAAQAQPSAGAADGQHRRRQPHRRRGRPSRDAAGAAPLPPGGGPRRRRRLPLFSRGRGARPPRRRRRRGTRLEAAAG